MSFSFYPNHEFACPQVRHCPHLGGAALGTLVLLANHSDDTIHRLHLQLDATRKSVSDLVAENEVLKREVERLKLELKLERQNKFATNQQRQADAAENKPVESPDAAQTRKLGAPVGHPGWFRPTPTEYDTLVEVAVPAACPHCGGPVSIYTSQEPTDHLQEDVVAGRPHVTLFRHPKARCRSCRNWVQTAGEGEILGSMIGPQLRAIAAYLAAHRNNGTPHDAAAPVQTLLDHARSAHREGKHEAAVDLLTRALATDPDNADVHWQCASALLALGQLDDAAAGFHEACRLRPESAPFHNDLGVVLARLGRREEAAAQYREAIRLKADFPDPHNNLGNTLRLDGRLDEAVACYREAIRLRPAYPEAFNNLGLALRSQGKHVEAVSAYHEALRLRPTYPEAHQNLGMALAAQGRHDAAVACFQQAIRLRPGHAEAFLSLGGALQDLNRHDEAVAAFNEAIKRQPKNARAHKNLGIVYARQNKFDDSIRCYREALRLRPDYADAHNDLGIALARQNKFAEAAESYRRALEHRPNYAEAHNNLGNALRNLGKFAEALAAYDRAIELKPSYSDAYNNRGIAFAEMARFDEAVASYTRCLSLRPQHVDAHLNRALTWLRQGNFALGWAEYESRLRKRSLSKRPQLQPAWNGFPPRGLRILLIAEQGLGDSLQFIRYAPVLKQMGATVIFECPEKLLKLFEGLPGIDILFPHGTEAPPHDMHAALMSLPGLLGTTLETVPAGIPYIQADPARAEHWGRELAAYPEFKVGINWQGNPGYAGDFHRSMPLAHFAPLAHMPGVRLFSLQKYHGTEQLKELGGAFPVVDLGSRLDDGDSTGPFLDTAAVLKNLDLFVTSDTAVAHLAGALGVPVWVPLSTSASWQWMHEREDCPWYPTMRLFRQGALLDWPPVFERMAAALRALVPPTTKARAVAVDVAPGELIDKLTILEIKAERIHEPEKLAHVHHEQHLLAAALDRAVIPSADLMALRAELRTINEELWRVEDAIRDCDHRGDFGPEFVALAQSVYRTNDRRAGLKRQINDLLGSEVVEEKSYGVEPAEVLGLGGRV